MRRLYILLILLATLGASLKSIADDPQMQKVWKFQGKEGAVEIELTQFLDQDGTRATSLHIYSPDGAPRSVAEETGFLATVLDDLPKTGITVQSLNWISFRFNESEAVRRVAAYAASSKQWKSALKTKNISVVYPLVTSFLNDSGAYNEWYRIFRKHGLTLKIVGVEEVIMEPFSQTGASCPRSADCKNLIVPKDALVQMNIYALPPR